MPSQHTAPHPLLACPHLAEGTNACQHGWSVLQEIAATLIRYAKFRAKFTRFAPPFKRQQHKEVGADR